jgi:hypothetical protein
MWGRASAVFRQRDISFPIEPPETKGNQMPDNIHEKAAVTKPSEDVSLTVVAELLAAKKG